MNCTTTLPEQHKLVQVFTWIAVQANHCAQKVLRLLKGFQLACFREKNILYFCLIILGARLPVEIQVNYGFTAAW